MICVLFYPDLCHCAGFQLSLIFSFLFEACHTDMYLYLLIVILFIHGLFHLLGTLKVFEYGNLQSSVPDHKPVRWIWITAFLLFVVTAIVLWFGNKSWWKLALLSVILSQILIITRWKEAKYGTIINILILIAVIPAYATSQFDILVKKESQSILARAPLNKREIINESMLDGLPGPVKQWLNHSGIVGKEKLEIIRLKQNGEMRTKTDGSWMPFIAEQYITTGEPAFIWKVDVKAYSFLHLVGRDKFESGKGDMLIKLGAIYNLVNTHENVKLNAASMIRWLAEISWYPSAALSHFIHWDSIGTKEARATINYDGISVSGNFTFNDHGDITRFSALRYLDVTKDSKLETWVVEMQDWKTFQGIRVPYTSKLTWKLASGDFNWTNIVLTDLEYNNPVLF